MKMMLKLLRIVGARPQFMQVKPLHEELKKRGHQEVILHTGQHYDDPMSKQFFIDLDLPNADINLKVGSGNHGEQTARMMQGIEAHLCKYKYNAVIVDGDTNSTLAGALVASKLQIPVVHVEAGMRSFDKKMPEEINRILTDRVSEVLFCPSKVSQDNLKNEGITKKVYVVGDLLAQCFYEFKEQALLRVKNNLEKYSFKKNDYILLTFHRAENVDSPERCEAYLKAIATSPLPVVFPIHPRTKKNLAQFGLDKLVSQKPFHLIPPVGYLDMLALESASAKILTDSGGVQREAYHWRKPAVILRDRTEWTEIIESLWARLYTPEQNFSCLWEFPNPANLTSENFYGSTEVASKIVNLLEENLL